VVVRNFPLSVADACILPNVDGLFPPPAAADGMDEKFPMLGRAAAVARSFPSL